MPTRSTPDTNYSTGLPGYSALDGVPLTVMSVYVQATGFASLGAGAGRRRGRT